MSRKKKILFVTESDKLASGFGTYAKEIIPRINATGKYEVAQLVCYGKREQYPQTDWLTYMIAPNEEEAEYEKQHTQNPLIQWGISRFENVCLDFKPDIVMTYRDPWMDGYIGDSPLLPFFHWVWMPTIDSEPQKTEWLYNYFNRCDSLLAYSEYGIRVLSKQTNGRLVPVGCASPAIDPSIFNIIPNKEEHKERFGLPKDSFIVGTVMRNQKRKMFPELIASFKIFLEQAPKEIANKSYLYLHTSHPEKMGWNISSLIHEYGIGSRVLTTYVCKNCKGYFSSHYRDAITICNKCKKHAAVLPGVTSGIDHKELVNIYNLMDLYVQYAICEGFGMPMVEAAACGTAIAAIDYSAMEDVVRFVDGYPIESNRERELETEADRCKANNDRLVEIMLSHAKQNEQQRKIQRLKTRKGCIQRYNWEDAAKSWEKHFDEIDISKNSNWNSPAMIKPVPKNYPKNMTNTQFCEWICSSLIQDQYHCFNYKMLSMLRDLNFGASFGGKLEKCTQETLYNENKHLAERRFIFDSIRSGDSQGRPQDFIEDAHRRLKK